ncbi:MAG TPA: CPBP family intramembrane glutamic endopeptidase [Anaerolineales bacterium]|nr:CPBP family intramembrane glutamic endopeptidase [Anaerolineales bacterium]
MKVKLIALLEILLVYAAIQIVGIVRRSTGIVEWEIQTLGWSYTGMFIFVGIPALVMWLTRRDWAEYGVSLVDWQTNLDIGIKAYLARIIPYVFGVGGAMWLMLDRDKVSGGAFVALMEIVGLAVMLWVLNRQKPMKSGRGNLIITCLLLLFPILLALTMNELSVAIVSTVVWQFVFSGFGEEFVWRGYVQSRLNQAFGRPMRLFGVQFGWGLIIASILFGLLHAFNTYDPAIGFASLAWGSALSSAAAGLMFGVIREKTGTLLAPGIAHGLPDAVGEALAKIFGWM